MGNLMVMGGTLYKYCYHVSAPANKTGEHGDNEDNGGVKVVFGLAGLAYPVNFFFFLGGGTTTASLCVLF